MEITPSLPSASFGLTTTDDALQLRNSARTVRILFLASVLLYIATRLIAIESFPIFGVLVLLAVPRGFRSLERGTALGWPARGLLQGDSRGDGGALSVGLLQPAGGAGLSRTAESRFHGTRQMNVIEPRGESFGGAKNASGSAPCGRH